MTPVWGNQQATPNGWFMTTEPDRFSITFVRGSARFVLGERVSNGRYTHTRVIGGFDSVLAAQAEAERIAAGGQA